jgi:hypothetical protein
LKLALEATYKEAFSVTGKVTDEQKNMLSTATIRAFVLGGDGNEATGIVNGFDGIVKFIKAGGNYSKMSPGAPIAYKLAYLDNTVTRLAFSTDYSERECMRNRGTLHAELKNIHHISGTDADSNQEFYGYVTVRYPTETKGVMSCTSGGTERDLWRINQGAYQTVAQYSTWTPPSPVYQDFSSTALGKGQFICIAAHMWESDVISDDDFGGDARLIAYENGWEGDHALQLRGPGNSAVDVTVSISIK